MDDSTSKAHVSPSLGRRLAAEGLGTGLLLAVIVGSGIAGERLSGGNTALALLANSLATGFGLLVLIGVLGPVSGAHFNPAVTFSMAARNVMTWSEAGLYAAVQLGGASMGVVAAHFMFALPLISISQHERSGVHLAWSEFMAAFGLALVVWGCLRQRVAAAPALIAAYISAAYWFTSSTSFANPAVTIARGLSNTFAGIRPDDVPGFLFAQILGTLAATALSAWLFPDDRCASRAERPRHIS